MTKRIIRGEPERARNARVTYYSEFAVPMYVCMYVCMYLCMYMYMHVCSNNYVVHVLITHAQYACAICLRIAINDLARMLKYRALDCVTSKGRHLRRGDKA